jgi:CRISPR-associated protein Cst2
LLSFVKPLGAHRSTQLPHLVNFEGVVAVSTSTIPAPTISPLNESYQEEIIDITSNLNRLNEAITTYSFKSQSEFTKIMVDLIEQVR